MFRRNWIIGRNLKEQYQITKSIEGTQERKYTSIRRQQNGIYEEKNLQFK